MSDRKEGTPSREFTDPLRTIAAHLGNALVNALSDGERDDGLILGEVEAAAECCAELMDDSDAFTSVYAVYEFLGGDVSRLRGVQERGEVEATRLTDAALRRAEDMPL